MLPPALRTCVRLLIAASSLLSASHAFATAPALDPSNARGVFWKQQKLMQGSETNVSEAPGTWNYNRAAIFTQLKNQGVNVVVIDIDANVRLSAQSVRDEIGQFITDLYNWDTTMPIKVWLHQRRYFTGGTDLTKTPDQNDAEFDEAAQDLKSIFATVSTAVSAVIDGVRWGENGDATMDKHLKRAILYARKINATSYKGATGWLTNHSYIVNGYDMGCEFKGLLAAQDSVGFSAKIGPEVGAFGFAYKHFSDRPAGGMGAIYTAYRNSFSPPKADTVQTWMDFYRDELGLGELQTWRDTRNSSKLKNYIYVGDSADAVSTTPANSLDAMKQFFVPKIKPVFMIPVAATSEQSNSNSYYKDTKILFWMSGALASPTFTNSTSISEWSTGW